MNSPLSINDLLNTVAAQFSKDLLAANTVAEVADFMQARLAVLLQNDYAQDTVAAVLAQHPDRLDDLADKIASR